MCTHYATKIISVACATCNIVFGISDEIYSRRKRDGGVFYCPNGHENAYRDTECDKLRAQTEALKQAVAARDRKIEAAKCERERYKRRWIAQKSATTRLSRKANGT